MMSMAPPLEGHDTLSHCMKAYKHGPNSRMSITFNSSKGLTNAPGQNNCFLNSAVQVLWHLDAFRRSFRLLSGHSCMGNACIFCALKVMFTQFQYSDKQVLPPDALRQALSETFQNQQRFQMGYMDDAAECFENILTRIHTHIAPGESEDTCTVAHCLPHRKFSMSVSEQVVCGGCGAKSEPFTFNEMVFYVSTGALVAEHKSHTAEQLSRLSFSQLLKSTVTKGEVRSCPVNCGEFGEKRRDLTNIPDVVSIGLVWESAKSGSQHIRDVVSSIGTSLDLSEMFHSTPSGAGKPQPLQLVGVVCYYGKHYSTFFLHSKVHEWIYFDDASVKTISDKWARVCEKLCKGRHQPLLLLYMNPNTEAVDISSAPKFSTMAQGYEWKSEDHSEPVNGLSAAHDIGPVSMAKGRRSRAHVSNNDSRYDEVDAVYAASHLRKERMRRHSEKLPLDRQHSGASTGLSRQDSGVSSQSSRSHAVESDCSSRVSAALTQHSSDSGSFGHQINRQESDTASSYCSRSSVNSLTSTLSTFSAVESEDTGYAGLHVNGYTKEVEQSKERQRVSLKKKKMANRMDADIVRHHSKSQVSLVDVHNQSYDDSSLSREVQQQMDADQKTISYATLPRKKRSTPSAHLPANPVKVPDVPVVEDKDNADVDQSACGRSVTSRIQMFNGINEQSAACKSSSKPPEMKPLLNLSGNGGEGPSYINTKNVEKILNQQRKVSSRPSTKMVRPTYDEQFNVPEEYITDTKRPNTVRYDTYTSDNTSIGSLKDSGYKSLGGSNSTSSVSSISTGSPTANSSFTFDTKEHIYCEPPPISSAYGKADGCNGCENGTDGMEEFDFPPPPPELLGGNHSKQLSEASILSEASTLKHRKTPSVESLDTLPTSYSLLDGLTGLSLNDSKLKSVIQSAEESLEKSFEQEDRSDINGALVLCQQSLSLLSSVLNQRPEDRQLERLVQSKYDYCMSRVHKLQTAASKHAPGRHVMSELHIDNQTRRETASADYTPLRDAMHHAPPPPARDRSHRLSRTDSQISNSSAGSHRSSTTCDSNSTDKTVNNIVPTQLQRSIAQLQQKQQREQAQQSLQPSTNVQSYPQEQTRQPISRQTSQQTLASQPVTTQRVHHGSGLVDSESKGAGSLYREVHIPTTLQRMDYIRDGYKPRTDCPSPSVIPPPKEFQESSSRNTHIHASQHNGALYTAQPSNYSNSTQSKPTYAPSTQNGYRDLPPKQSINKQNIRDLLVQDMLKRKGQQGSVDSSIKSASSRLPLSYDSQFDEPLWTPPQQTAYERGLSHYDRPNHQRQNLYGQVNSQPSAVRHPSNSRQPSLYGEKTDRRKPAPAQNESRINHCHTYSTEL